VSAVLKSRHPSVVMRPLRSNDVPAALAIEQVAYDFPWTEGIFRDCVRVGYSCWLLEEDGLAVGYGILAPGVNEAHLLNVCIDPKAQGRGLGTRLLTRMLDLARWHHARSVFLEVRPSNRGAITLYKRFGFRVIGIRPDYYRCLEGREDAVVMSLTFAEKVRAVPPARTPDSRLP